MVKTKSISFTKKKITEGAILYMINIENLDMAIKSLIDTSLVNICKGDRKTKIETVKKQLSDYLKAKGDSALLTGSIAEFFIHLFLNQENFQQNFLYFNLEEGSIKKGFDGYYTKNNNQWILESKSGLYSAKNMITHPAKINEAYKGLKNKIEGQDSVNNPWENAYNHASHTDVKTSKNIRDIINQLSEDYTNKKFRKVSEFNLIPCSTIFLESNWNLIDESLLLKKIKAALSNMKFKEIKIICLNKKSLKSFIEYLDEGIC